MIRLFINNQEADVLQNEFTWNLQCADFFSFDTRQFTYSNVMYLPITDTNSTIFDIAHAVGHNSSITNKSFEVECYIDGLPVIKNAIGYLMGIQFGTYKFAFNESTRDLYHSLNLWKLSDILGVELNHNKSPEQLRKYNAEYVYSYIYSGDYDLGVVYPLAEYGGDTITSCEYEGSVENAYNFYYCPPAVSMRWIFEQVQRRSGKEFVGKFFNTWMFKTLFISASQVISKKAPEGELSKMEVAGRASVVKDSYIEGGKGVRGRLHTIRYMKINKGNPSYFYLDKERNPIMEVGNDLKGQCDFYLKARITGGVAGNCIEVYRNNESTPVYSSDEDSKTLFNDTGKSYKEMKENVEEGKQEFVFEKSFENEFKAGDKVYVRFITRSYQGGDAYGFEPNLYDITTKLTQTSWTILNDLFSEFSMLDLFKEILIMFGLTSIKLSPDDERQHFYTIEERLYEAPVIDWSDKYIRYTNLEFHCSSSSYSQKNFLKYKKYDEQEAIQTIGDGVIEVKDELLTFKRERLGKFFSEVNKDKGISHEEMPDLDNFWYWEKEIKEKEDNGQKVNEVSYKQKDNRFHIFNVVAHSEGRIPTPIQGTIREGEAINKGFDILPCYAKFERLWWKNLINDYYSDFIKLLNNMKIYTCEMNLTALDLYEFNFFKRIYINQLGGYFLPNKITYKAGQRAIVELIKIEPLE